jgi:hypothetical protein
MYAANCFENIQAVRNFPEMQILNEATFLASLNLLVMEERALWD